MKKYIVILACLMLSTSLVAKASSQLTASVPLSSINEILEKVRYSGGLNQCTTQTIGGGWLPVSISVSFESIYATLLPTSQEVQIDAKVKVSSNFSFPIMEYGTSESYFYRTKAQINFKTVPGQSGVSIELCPKAVSIAPPTFWCVASGQPIECAIGTEVIQKLNTIIEKKNCVDVSALSKMLPQINNELIVGPSTNLISVDKIGITYEIKKYQLPSDVVPTTISPLLLN